MQKISEWESKILEKNKNILWSIILNIYLKENIFDYDFEINDDFIIYLYNDIGKNKILVWINKYEILEIDDKNL